MTGNGELCYCCFRIRSSNAGLSLAESVAEFKRIQNELFRTVSFVFVGCWFVAITWSVATQDKQLWLHLLCFSLVLLSFVLPSRLPWLKHLLLYLSTYIVGVEILLTLGTAGEHFMFVTFSVFLATVLHSARLGALAMGVCLASIFLAAFLIVNEFISLEAGRYVFSDTWRDWSFEPISFSAMSGTIVVIYSFLIRRLASTTEKSVGLI